MAYSLRSKKTWREEYAALAHEFELWHVKDWTVSAIGRAGQAYQGEDERRVIVKYSRDGVDTTLEMDKQERAVDNLRVLTLCIADVRLAEVRGLGNVMRAAYLALPAPVVERDPYDVLMVLSGSSLDVCNQVYRTLSKAAAGDEARQKELNLAIEKIRAERAA